MLINKKRYNLLDIVKIPIKCSPFHSIIIAILKIIDGIIPNIQILVTAKFIDTSILVVTSNTDSKNTIPLIIAIIILIGYTWISGQLVKFFEIKLEIKLREKLKLDMIEKRSKLSYYYIENSDTWDLISRVCTEPEIKLKKSYIIFLSLISMFIKVIGILVILLTQVWWAALAILIFSTPLFFLSIKSGKIIYNANKDVSKQKRKYMYLNEVLTERKYVDERTLFGFGKTINDKWFSTYNLVRKVVLKAELNEIIKSKIVTLMTSFISIFIIIILVNSVIDKLISIGLFISIVNYVTSLIKMMSSDLPWFVRELAKTIEYLNDLTLFSELNEESELSNSKDYESFLFNKLEFINVKFKYPNTDYYILNNVSFTIENGKHYAFVGVNGAGKTTIIKLITGLYTEYEGKILINDIEIKEYSKNFLNSFISVVYQDFAKYSISLKDNIIIGKLNDIPDEKLFSRAISYMNLNDLIDKLPNGINTHIGKIKKFGVDISEGQWQRIAIARSIMNVSSIRILDEPTSSLDPISESAIYEKFEEISKNKTTIFISHRLGSTKLADKIFVLGNGYIIEEGTHNELINKNKLYKNMYESQKGWYS